MKIDTVLSSVGVGLLWVPGDPHRVSILGSVFSAACLVLAFNRSIKQNDRWFMKGPLGEDGQQFICDNGCVKGKTKTAWIGKLKRFRLHDPP